MRLPFNTNITFVFLLILFSGKSILGQNLVYNSSFEIIEKCPDAGDLGPELITLAEGWSNGNGNTPDLYCDCDVPFALDPAASLSNELPVNGNCYAALCGFSPTNREYILGELITPLKKNIKYCANMYISLNEAYSNYEIKSLGIYFVKEIPIIETGKELYASPQVMQSNYLPNPFEGWHLVEGSFVAEGGEKYIIIGNFLPDSLTDTLQWQNLLKYKFLSYYIIDDISVECCDPMGCGLTIPNGITPNGDGYNETWKIEGLVPGVRVWVYNRWGAVVFHNNSYDGTWDGGDLPNGTYYYVAEEPGGERYKGFLDIRR